LFLFCFDSNNENILLKFDGLNEEWESLLMNQKNIVISEESQALQIDKDLILLSGGKNRNSKPTDEFYGTNLCQLYVIKKNRFYPFPNLNVPRACHMMINYGDTIYCMGGRSENNENEGITSSVERANIHNFKNQLKEGVDDLTVPSFVKLKWEEVEPFTKPRYSALTFMFKEEIYLLGGMGRNKKICKFVEKYDSGQNQWLSLDWKLPFSINCAVATALNQSELLIIGGKNESGLTPSIYQLDFEKKRYHSKGAFSFRVNPKILHYKDELYIFGGDKEMSCEKLNPTEFVSYAASESYTSFINNDLSTFPGGQTAIRLGENLTQESEVLIKVFENDLKISKMKTYDVYYTFGTPNHPFILEYTCENEIVKFSPVSFVLKFYYYGAVVRLNPFFGLTMGGIIPPHKKASKQTHLVDFRTMSCKKMAKTNIGRCKCFMLGNEDDNKVYLIGGITFEGSMEKHLASVERFDLMENKWEKMNDMLTPRYNANGFFSRKLLYVFGGSDGHVYLDSVEVFNPIENKWELLNELKMPKPLSNFTINHFEASTDEFLIIGGANKENFNNELYILRMNNPSKYDKLIELKEPRSGHKVFTSENNFVIIGGSRSDVGVEVLKMNPLEIVTNEFKKFDEALNKYYRDKTLGGVQSC